MVATINGLSASCLLTLSKTVSFSTLYPPVCLGHLEAQQILVECGWAKYFKFKIYLRTEKAGKCISSMLKFSDESPNVASN